MDELTHDQLEIKAVAWGDLSLDGLPAGMTAICDTEQAVRRLAQRGMSGVVVPPAERQYAPSAPVSDGVYFFTPQGQPIPSLALAVDSGVGDVRGRSAYLDDALIDDDELVNARDLLQRWRAAVGKRAVSQFKAGDLVRDKSGRMGRVQRADPIAGSTKYRVELSPGNEIDLWEDDVTPAGPGAGGPEQWIEQDPGSHRDAAQLLTLAKLGGDLTDTVYSHMSGTFQFRAYQFRPLLRLLQSPRRRLLVADEVGLGKTVEAGLIWSELESRASLQAVAERRPAPGFRVLVVCPAPLVGKWREEMLSRFGRRLVKLDAPGRASLIELLREQRFDEPFAGVVSLPTARNRSFIESLAPFHPSFDLVIVDEAHHLRNRGTASFRAAEFLDDWAEALIFLSATPLNLGRQDLFNLVQLLDETNFRDFRVFEQRLEPNRYLNEVSAELADGAGSTVDGRRRLARTLHAMQRETSFGQDVALAPGYHRVLELLSGTGAPTAEQIATARRELADLNALSGILTRTRKVDVPDHKALREAQDVSVEWTWQEQAFYDAVYALCARRAHGTSVKFAGQMWLRQAASCIPAMQGLLQQRTADGTISPDELAILCEELVAADPDPDSALSAGELAEQDAALGSFPSITAAMSPGLDTKGDKFLQLLDDLRGRGIRQIMVFSSFVGTVNHLRGLVSAHGIRCEAIHGQVDPETRDEVIRSFRDGGFEVLILSEVGSEGLDFEFCNVLINYDLPWNPMRVEQRIGRLDRFGQQHSKILVYNLTVPGTIEADIFLRLYHRIGVFKDSIGELEPIMQGWIRDAAELAINPDLTPAERQTRVDQILQAQENKRHDLSVIRENEAGLLGIDDVVIQDFEADNPGQGRYLGSTEIRVLVERFFDACGHGALTTDGEDLVRVIGNQQLSHILGDAHSANAWKRLPGEDVIARLEKPPYLLALTPEAASKSGRRLLNLRHPLVKSAHWYLLQNLEQTRRFAAVSVPGLCSESAYIVTVRLLNAGGVRPRRQLWGAALDIASRRLVPDVFEPVLAALARGALEPWNGPVPRVFVTSASELLKHVQAEADAIELRRRREYAEQNAYLASARTREVDAEFTLKMERDRIQAAAATDETIRRLFMGKVEANRERLRRQQEKLRRDADFAFESTTIALLLVRGT